MNQVSKNAFSTFPARALTEDEHCVLLDWVKAAKEFSAFVSERRTDDPAIHRRIVVYRRTTRQQVYLIHSPINAAGWVIVSASTGEDVQRFPALHTALNYVEPVKIAPRATEASASGKVQVASRTPQSTGSRSVSALKITGWACVLLALLVAVGWFGWGRDSVGANRDAETIAEKVVQDTVSDPGSVQFRNVMAHQLGVEHERWVCGWFNAKNAAGEFLGYQRFVVHVLLADGASPGDGSGVKTHLLTSDDEVPGLTYAWENYCR